MEIQLENVQGEEREGFYIQPMMKRMWAVQLDILRKIDNICRHHDIRFYGWYGTLLGAVRHQGFIPWDDDIDLAMHREDYEKFQYFCETELPKEWTVSKVSPTLICIMNTNVIRLDQKFLDRYHGCPFITGVDIFCLDRIPQGKDEEALWLNLFYLVCNLYEHWDLFEDEKEWREGKWEHAIEIEKLTGYRFNTQFSMKEQLYFLADKIAAMYWDAEFDEVTNVPWMYKDHNYRIPQTCFDRTIEVPFEDTKIPIVEDYDLVCRLIYGNDYMIPVRKNTHDIFKQQMDVIRDYFKDQGKTVPECLKMIIE